MLPNLFAKLADIGLGLAFARASAKFCTSGV